MSELAVHTQCPSLTLRLFVSEHVWKVQTAVSDGLSETKLEDESADKS
jgi:hypothetical protein